MKYCLSLLALLGSLNAYSQFFSTDTTQFIEGTAGGSLDLADVDNDGDLDLLISGLSGNTNLAHLRILQLHLNDGQGNFSLHPVPSFMGISHLSKAKFADFNGDGLPDILALGYDENGVESARLYENLGSGSFAYKPSNLVGLKFGDFDFADVDGDGDLDLFLSGRELGNSVRSDLYLNKGNWNFEADTSQSFEKLELCHVRFADFDGDSDPDLLHYGGKQNMGADHEVHLYLNDGSGQFSPSTNHGLVRQGVEGLQVIDIDNDNDLDLLITGFDLDASGTSVNYWNGIQINNGNAQFSNGFNFTSLACTSISAADINQDQELDILISGIRNVSINPVATETRIYLSNAGQYSTTADTTMESHTNSCHIFGDVDGDNDPDLIVTGDKNVNPPAKETLVYINGPQSIGLAHHLHPSKIELYPNPSKGIIKLTGLVPGPTAIAVFNESGQCLLKQSLSLSNEALELNLSDFKSGFYQLQIQNKQGLQTIPLVLQ